jgi:opacity protein-like surface antigen
MRSVTFLVAAGAASLLSSVAFAADMAIAPPPMYSPPPVQEFGGWYLRGDIGFSNQSVGSVRLSNPAAYTGLTSFNQTSAFDTAGTFQVGVGYQVNNWFRADITGEYRGKANFKGTDLITFPWGGGSASGIDNYNASKSELLFLANAYVDLGTWWCVTPFIGAGVGTSRVTISNFTDTGVNNANFTALGVPVVSGPPVASFAAAQSASQWNFAWAAHAGLSYKVSQNLILELAYSYIDLGTGATGPVRTFDAATHGNVFTFKDITSHDLKLGVRWQLDNPPVYQPPLVRKG